MVLICDELLQSCFVLPSANYGSHVMNCSKVLAKYVVCKDFYFRALSMFGLLIINYWAYLIILSKMFVSVIVCFSISSLFIPSSLAILIMNDLESSPYPTLL